jgi:hypothetical protein
LKHQTSKNWIVILLVVAGIALMALAAWQIFGTSDNSKTGLVQTRPSSNSPVERISPENAYAAYQAKQAVFVDVRGDEAYALSHIPGAISIPLAELPDRLGELNTKDWIITYCT